MACNAGEISTHGMCLPTTGGLGGGHPRLFWNTTNQAAAVIWLAANPFTPGANLEDTAFQHVINSSSCASAVTSALQISVPFGQWQPSAVGSDTYRTNSATVALVYDWCHDAISTSSPGSTTLGANSSSGQNVTLQVGINLATACGGGTCVGYLLQVDSGGSLEYMEITSVTDSTHVVVQNALNTHNSGAAVVVLSQRSSLLRKWNNYATNINQQSWGGPASPASNYFWGVMVGESLWGVATYDDQPDFSAGSSATAEGLLTDALNTRWTNNFIAQANIAFAGGAGLEGPEYVSQIANRWTAALMQTAKNLGRDLLGESTYLKYQFPYWMLYQTPGAQTYNKVAATPRWDLNSYSDNEIWENGGILYVRDHYEDFMGWLAAYENINYSNSLAGYLRQWLNQLSPVAPLNLNPNSTGSPNYYFSNFLKASDPGNTASSYAGLPFDYYASGYGAGSARAAWDASSPEMFWFKARGSAGVGHIFPGQFNSYSLWRNGRWVQRDDIGYSETIALPASVASTCGGVAADVGNAVGMNTLVFSNPILGSLNNACDMLPGVANGQPILLRQESKTAYYYDVWDVTDRFNWDAGHSFLDTGVIGQVITEQLFIRSLASSSVLVLLDRVKTNNQTAGSGCGSTCTAANVITTRNFHCEVSPTQEDVNHLRCDNGTETARTSILIPTSPTPRTVDESSCAGCNANAAQFRWEVDNSGNALRYHLSVVQVRAGATANITASVVDSIPADPTTGTFTVTLHPAAGSDTVVVFNKGQTSSGGTINVAGTGVTSLRSDIQGSTYNATTGITWAQAYSGKFLGGTNYTGGIEFV